MPATAAKTTEFQLALEAALDGCEVADDTSTLATYSTDASNYRHVPLLVVFPRSAADVVSALEVCAEHDVPVLPRGAATSIGGQAANRAVILDFTRHLNRILDIDPVARTATVEPGVVLDVLRAEAAKLGLTFGPDPSTHNRCTLGGMIGNNACGSHSVAWGKTVDNVRSLEIALRDGTRLEVGPTSGPDLEDLCERVDAVGDLYRSLRKLRDDHLADIRTGFPKLSRRVSGYNLEYLLPENGFDLAKALVGSEGTCATILSATVDLVPAPASRALAVLGFDSNVAAADAVPALTDLPVLTIEGIDSHLVSALEQRRPGAGAGLPDGAAWLYLETGGDTPEQAAEVARRVVARAPEIGASGLVVGESGHQRRLWRIREEGAGLATRLPDGSEAWSGWEDAAVPPERLGDYLREFEALLDKHGRRGVVYGHFGDGCLHVRIDFPFTAPDARLRYREFMSAAADLVVAHGGSLSGEHGDGQARSELLPKMFPPNVLDAFRGFKAAFDAGNGMNPGRIVDPASMDADLRVVVAPPVLPTRAQLALHADDGDLAAASRRCVGVGKCVSTSSAGVMCPSYRATRQEQHSTRGRARLLFEMLAGDVITKGWRSPEVREALDLCLGCKGCKSDCPVGVDMATYKVEFLSRFYRRRPRPASHYGMGALPRWLRLTPLAPRLINAVTRSRLAPALKRLGGVAPEREIPAIAATTFRRWFARHRGPAEAGRTPVVLWPDTFTNHFDPQVGRDAVAVLEKLGYDVQIPAKPVCCGLTWYSTGQLTVARKVLRRTLDALEPWLDRGVPIVGLEPSCTAMLRKDAAELLPGDERIPRLAAAVRSFAEQLAATPGLELGRQSERVLSQVHCHQYADLGFDADREVLARVSGDVDVLDGGCCGLAGNFGFERGHYDVSVACAEHELLPAVRAAAPGTDVHADGFSCRTQIRELSDREPVHLATLTARSLGVSGT